MEAIASRLEAITSNKKLLYKASNFQASLNLRGGVLNGSESMQSVRQKTSNTKPLKLRQEKRCIRASIVVIQWLTMSSQL